MHVMPKVANQALHQIKIRPGPASRGYHRDSIEQVVKIKKVPQVSKDGLVQYHNICIALICNTHMYYTDLQYYNYVLH